jgi:hypothetical protein
MTEAPQRWGPRSTARPAHWAHYNPKEDSTMKRTLQWTAITVACGLLATAFVTARPVQDDTVAEADSATPYPPVNVRVEDLFPRGR